MADEPIVIRFDKDRMTFGEMVDFEDITGIPIDELSGMERPSSRVMLAIAYIGLKRDDPTITLDAVKAMDVSTVDFEDPTEAAPEPLRKLEQPKGSTKRAKSSAA